MKNSLTVALLSILFFLVHSIKAQDVQIETVYLNSVYLDDSDIFSGVYVSNNSSKTVFVHLVGSLTNSNGKLLLEFNADAQIGEGSNRFEDFENVIINEYVSGLLNLMHESGTIPQSDFVFCVEMVVDGSKSEKLCFTQSSIINNELNLLYPYDKEEVNSLRPSLFWTFTASSVDVKYRCVLRKMPEGMNKTEASNFGEIIFQLEELPDEMVDFPLAIPDLIEGQKYLWQVEAYLGEISLGKTDFWEFEIGEPLDISQLPISKSYLDVDDIIGEPTVYVLGEMKLKLNEFSRKGDLNIKIIKFSSKGKKGKVVGKDKLNFDLGENYYTLNLKENYNLSHNKKYLLEVVNSNTQKESKIFFIYLNPDFVK